MFNEQKEIFEEAFNQSFTSILKLKKPISKIETANYQQRNVPNPFDFEYSESTITGYNIGLNLGNGMILSYVFRRTFKDLNGDGDVRDAGEMINMTGVETSFSFDDIKRNTKIFSDFFKEKIIKLLVVHLLYL